MVKADCSKCIYFIPASRFTEELRVKAYEKAGLLGKDINHIMGWCIKKHIPIDHLVGECRDFRPYKPKNRPSLPLTKWLGIDKEV